MSTSVYAEKRGHIACYFCRPDMYPPMPAYHTLCARCGELILTNVKGDPMNERLDVCYRCEIEIDEEIA